MKSPETLTPDQKHFQFVAEKIVRLAKCDPATVERIEINCGSSPWLGFVVLKDGQKIKV